MDAMPAYASPPKRPRLWAVLWYEAQRAEYLSQGPRHTIL